MCFYFENYRQSKIAEEDIMCYKITQSDLSNWFQYALGRRVVYTINKHMEQVKIYRCGDEINKGYHSFKSLVLAKEEIKSNKMHYKIMKHPIHKFVIPKGTLYYENTTQYVSETIMLIK
jgi:hypothetical protein